MSWKKSLACVMMCLTLTGCRGQRQEPGQLAVDFRTRLLEAGECTFTARIEADVQSRVYEFEVACRYCAAADGTICVLAPEEIAGISAKISGDGTTITFEDVELDFGKPAWGSISPLAAGWLLGRCWTGGYMDASGEDGELTRVTWLDGYGQQELTVDTWLEADGTPVYAEIAWDQNRCLRLELSDFNMGQEKLSTKEPA